MDFLSRPDLFQSSAYINGQWIQNGKLLAVTNPSTGAEIAHVSDCDATHVQEAVNAAHAALPAWAGKTAKDRSSILRRWFDLITQNEDDLAKILVTEQGKPYAEALGEIRYGASFVEWFAEETKRVYGDVIPSPVAGSRIVTLKQPVGVCAAITPWNFPMAMITRKVAPALAAGCTVVIKPAALTPLSALALARLAEEAGLPAGILNVVVASDSAMVGQVLCDDKRVRKLSFTGSTKVGKILMEQSAPTLKRLSMELGGNAPFIVFDDADVDAAIDGAVASKFRNAGQTCVCANRFYVHEAVYDAFVAGFAKRIADLRVADGMAEGTQIGPLIDKAALEKVEALLSDAVDRGASVLVGGKRHALGGLFFEPTLITDVKADMDLSCTEIFGPVAPVFKFSNEDEVLKQANQVDVGLASYFYARDLARVWRVAEALETGVVSVNSGIFRLRSGHLAG